MWPHLVSAEAPSEDVGGAARRARVAPIAAACGVGVAWHVAIERRAPQRPYRCVQLAVRAPNYENATTTVRAASATASGVVPAGAP